MVKKPGSKCLRWLREVRLLRSSASSACGDCADCGGGRLRRITAGTPAQRHGPPRCPSSGWSRLGGGAGLQRRVKAPLNSRDNGSRDGCAGRAAVRWQILAIGQPSSWQMRTIVTVTASTEDSAGGAANPEGDSLPSRGLTKGARQSVGVAPCDPHDRQQQRSTPWHAKIPSKKCTRC